MIKFSKISVGEEAKKLAEKYSMDPQLAQLIIDESDMTSAAFRGSS